MDWNQSMLDTLRCSVWQQAKTHHVLKMLLVWLQLLAFVVQLVTSLFFPISFPLYLCSPPQCPHSVFVVFCFFFRSSLSFQSASLASDFFPTARASCLTLPLSPCVCVCVCWTTILLIPLVMVCIGRGIKHDHWGWFFGCVITMKNKDSTPYVWRLFQRLWRKILNFKLDIHKQCSCLH